MEDSTDFTRLEHSNASLWEEAYQLQKAHALQQAKIFESLFKEKRVNAYTHLHKVLKEKNYFVVEFFSRLTDFYCGWPPSESNREPSGLQPDATTI